MYKFVFFILVLFCFSCRPSAEKKPSNLISKSEMITILTEMQIADALIAEQFDNMGATPKNAQYYDYLLKKHQISRRQFVLSLRYYLNDSKEFEQMCAEANQNIEKKKGEVAQQKTEHKNQPKK